MNDPMPGELRRKIDQLPREIPPGRDLWPEIKAGMEQAELASRSTPSAFRRWRIPLAVAAALAFAATLAWLRPPAPDGVWPVSPLAGTPRLDRTALSAPARLAVGQWLETDATSRAALAIGNIGEVQIQPNSRVRLVNAHDKDHRIELARGSLSALIWAPPRLFFVETAAATAIDLGCAYTLSVDDAGAGTLRVTSGYVALEHAGREALIPAGLTCLTRPGAGPGTPFSERSSPGLLAALQRFDTGRDDAAVADIVAAAAPGDEVTLWHLLDRAPPASRPALYERLAALQPPPAGVTRAGILTGDRTMRLRWAEELGLGPALTAR